MYGGGGGGDDDDDNDDDDEYNNDDDNDGSKGDELLFFSVQLLSFFFGVKFNCHIFRWIFEGFKSTRRIISNGKWIISLSHEMSTLLLIK